VEAHDGVPLGQVQQPRVVAHVQIGVTAQQAAEEPRHCALDARAPRHRQERKRAEYQPAEAVGGVVATGVDEGDRERDHRDDHTGAAPEHQHHHDAPTGRVRHHRLGLGGRVPGAGQRGARLEARGVARHAGQHQGDGRHPGDDQGAHQDEEERRYGDHEPTLPAGREAPAGASKAFADRSTGHHAAGQGVAPVAA
jgi:hypothetical protein